ncbi:MAG: hypothetical protein KJP05_11025, partial [Deltaproteobacteria bacterium]|nr:hypothetical protein [Deltaproteobacteria bacterium]
MFVFTVGTVLFVGVRIVVDQAFPVLDANLLLLLGISNGIYVGAKAASGESPFRAAERLDLELKVLEEARKNAADDQDRRAAEIAEIDAKVAAAKAN